MHICLHASAYFKFTFIRLIQSISTTVILLLRAVRNPYRFTQLGVGWVLRDVSVYHPDQVITFLRQHRQDMIKEGVRYAVEKMSPSQKARVRAAEDE